VEEDMRPPKPIQEEDRLVLKELLKTVNTKADYQRVQCLWLRAELGLNSTQIAAAVGFTKGTVRVIQAKYFTEKEASLIGTGKGGRWHQNLTVEEEDELLKSFFDKAKEGGVLIVSEIKQAYEAKLGRTVNKTTVYRMLERHNWRKIVPRPHHPKADPEAQEAFKKNSQYSYRKKESTGREKGKPSG
jgi:transposase